MTRQIPFWNDERVAKLRELVPSGKTSTEIGRELGCSRSAVLGKMIRLGLQLQTKEAERQRQYKFIKTLRANGTLLDISVAALPIKSRGHTAHPDRSDILHGVKPEIPRSSSTSSRDAVLGLGPRNCRFPSGDPRLSDFSFCMKPSPIYGYCSEHRELAYQATRPRVR